MVIRTGCPKMTPARAMFIRLMDQYLVPAYRLTLLEMQKLAYFLQEAGEMLRLRFQKGHYGPYAANLNKVLERIEGHFIRGYGDSQKPNVAIEPVHDAVVEAERFLAAHKASTERLGRVARLIEGFETPYGMELLSSAHWVAKHQEPPTINADAAIRDIHGWNTRKRLMFKPEHIRIAWEQLCDEGWLP